MAKHSMVIVIDIQGHQEGGAEQAIHESVHDAEESGWELAQVVANDRFVFLHYVEESDAS